MLQCKQKSLISDIVADKKLNAVADKAVNVDKKRNTKADKELNATVDKTFNADKRQNAAASKQPNAEAEPSVLVKDQITRRTKQKGWIGEG